MMPSPAPAQKTLTSEVPLGTIRDIALLAGAAIMEIYGRDFEVEIKADSSPLTEADVAAEAVILERLSAGLPHIPVIAEEAVANGQVPEIGNRFFLVDPLDGSKEFISRNGEFTVNIALIQAGAPVLGVVYAPALKRVWWGATGQGAWAGDVENGQVTGAAPIAVRSAPKDGLTLVGSRSHGSGEGNEQLSGLEIARFASMGSSLKFCLVAEGQADLYPRFGRTMEWDTAAGDAILRAAGGQVLDCDGGVFRYGKRNQSHDSDFANGPFWALGDDSLVPAIRGAANVNPVVSGGERT